MADDTGTNGEHDDRTIGRRLRAIRLARRKSLRVVAGLAGISHGQLSKIENGKAALDRRSLIVKLANALEISPSELTALPTPAPADGTSDSSISSVRRAIMAVTTERPGGQVQPVEQLRARVEAVENSDYERRGVELPGLIVDLHTTLRPEMTAAMLRDHVDDGTGHCKGCRWWQSATPVHPCTTAYYASRAAEILRRRRAHSPPQAAPAPTQSAGHPIRKQPKPQV